MATQYNKMTVSGTLPSGEVWSCGAAYKREDLIQDNVIRDYEGLLDQANVAWGVIRDWESTDPLRTLLSVGGAINKVRWEYRDGPELIQAAEVTGTPVAGFGAMTKTFQTSLVFSLLTGRAGRSYRGRIYWPALGAVIEADGRVQTSRIQNAANQMAEFLKDAGRRGGGQPDVDPGVYSSTLDVWTPIESVEVGNVLDTQRRRRDSLIEARVSAEIPS